VKAVVDLSEDLDSAVIRLVVLRPQTARGMLGSGVAANTSIYIYLCILSLSGSSPSTKWSLTLRTVTCSW